MPSKTGNWMQVSTNYFWKKKKKCNTFRPNNMMLRQHLPSSYQGQVTGGYYLSIQEQLYFFLASLRRKEI